MGIKEFATAGYQTLKQVVSHPIDSTAYGLGQTGKAVSNSLPKVPSFKPINQRALPDQNFENGNTWGSQIKDSFVPSQRASSGSKNHACNFVPGQTSNIHGGQFDFSA